MVLWYSIDVVTKSYEVISVIFRVTVSRGIELASSRLNGAWVVR